MSTRKKFEVEIPEGTRLDNSRASEGGFRATLRDDNNDLVGHAELFELSDDQEGETDSEDIEIPAGVAAVAVAVVTAGATLVGVKVVSRIREARREKKALRILESDATTSSGHHGIDGHARLLPPAGWCEDPSGHIRWWDGRQWTEHVKWTEVNGGAAHPASVQPATTVEPANEVGIVHEHEQTVMSSAEWQARARAMLLAQAFSEQQRRLLANARVVDADDALLQNQRDLRSLTAQQFSDRLSAILDQQATPLRAPALAPSGWYDDGSGSLRWWDSRQWTEHVHLVAVKPRTPMSRNWPAAAGWYDDGSGRQRWWTGRHWA